jgi:hypothetical protein
MLRFYRTRARLSQEQLGALVHFSGDLVGKIENGQRSHLMDMARRQNIVVQIIPASTGAHEGLRGPFTIADYADAPSVAWQDTAVFGDYVQDATGLACLMAVWEAIKAEALPRSASYELIEEIAKAWTCAASTGARTPIPAAAGSCADVSGGP